MEFRLTLSTTAANSELIRREVAGLPHDEIHSHGIEGTPDIVIWCISLASTSPLLIKLIGFVDQRIRELHARGKIRGLKIERDGSFQIDRATPDQVVELLKAASQHATDNQR